MQEENKYYKYLQLMYHIQTSKTRKTKKKDWEKLEGKYTLPLEKQSWELQHTSC
jgi:hypothetical protein